MKRQKRKYIFLIIAACFLLICSVGLYSSIESCFFYGRTQGTVISVKTEIHEGSMTDDTRNYTESRIMCSYIVDDKEYVGRYKYKNDYSRLEGKTVTVLYNKEDPYESVMEEINTKGFLSSIILTIICVCFIIFDIRQWINIRKEENERMSQAAFSDTDMQQYTAQMRKQKKINIILIIASVLGLVLFVLDIPLIVYTIARNVDYRSCNSFC